MGSKPLAHTEGSRPKDSGTFTDRLWESARHPERLTQIGGYLLLSAGAIVMLASWLWMLSTAFKKTGQEWAFPPVWIPNPIWWRNYPEAIAILPIPFYRYVLSTLVITIGATAGTVFSSSLAAFGFARLRFKGRDALFILVISTMMLPSVVTLVPTFLIFRSLGWLNTFLPLIVPYWFGGSAFSIFLLRQFFMTIPREFDEAARIDGASSLLIFWSVILPLAQPAVVTVSIFEVIAHWNDFVGPLIYLDSMQNHTLALGLRTFQNVRSQRANYLMALSSLQILPVVVLFFMAQKYFIRGITLTGLSGR